MNASSISSGLIPAVLLLAMGCGTLHAQATGPAPLPIVTLTARPVLKAELRLVEPADGAVFQAPTRIGMTAKAMDPEGFIYDVDFYAGDRKIGTSQIRTLVAPPPGTVALHSFAWEDPPAGQYVITARATTSASAALRSPPVAMTVRPARPSGTDTVVTVVATDPKATEPGRTRVLERNTGMFTFSRTGNLRHPLTATYAVGGTAQNGTDYVRLPGTVVFPAGLAIARVPVLPMPDTLVEEQETVTVTVLAGADYAPGRPSEATVLLVDTPSGSSPMARLKITEPVNGSVFALGTDVAVAATAIDPESYIARVEFYADGKSLGASELAFFVAPDPGTPIHHVFVWKNAPLGRHLLTAQARDSHGQLVLSPTVGIAVTEGRVPPPGGGVIRLADGRLLLGLSAPSADTYTVEASVDLRTWTPLATGVGEDGMLSFIDGNPDRGPAGFYRAVPLR